MILAALVAVTPDLPFTNPVAHRLLAGSLQFAAAGSLLAAAWSPALALAALGLAQAYVLVPLLHPLAGKPWALDPAYLLWGDPRYLGVAAQLMVAVAVARLLPRQGPVLGLLYLALPGSLASVQTSGWRPWVALAVVTGLLVHSRRRQ